MNHRGRARKWALLAACAIAACGAGCETRGAIFEPRDGGPDALWSSDFDAEIVDFDADQEAGSAFEHPRDADAGHEDDLDGAWDPDASL